MKYRLKFTVWLLLVLLLLNGCSAPSKEGSSADSQSPPPPNAVVFTDALGYEVALTDWARVVSLYGSFAETWLLAGGTLVGTTSDAIEERDLNLGDASIVGTVKTPNLESILATEPDFVILAADIAGQADLHQALTDAGISHAYYRTDTFTQYLAMLEQFCFLTGREDLYEMNGLAIEAEIQQVLASVKEQDSPSVLLVRAFSSGAKAKGADNLAGVILEDLGADNLVSRYDSLLEDLSMEIIIAADPDFIFITTMGSGDEAAMSYMQQTFEQNPAWAGLSAVQNGRYHLLPRDLFHYKPNARWGESYAYLANILYPEAAN